MTTNHAPLATLTPAGGAERLEVLDAIRGVAVCGILFINIDVLSGYIYLRPVTKVLPYSAPDAALDVALSALVHGKFYLLFSFLFGVGFAVFASRSDAREVPAAPLFRRRMVGLLAIGLLHSVLLWFGDILLVYALLGLLLPWFLRRSDRSLVRWGVAIFALPVLIVGLRFAFTWWRTGSAQAADSPNVAPPFFLRAIEDFRAGSYLEIVRSNALITAIGLFVRRWTQGPRIFAMFLFGLWAARAGVFSDVSAWRPRLRRALGWGLAVGLPVSAAVELLPKVGPVGAVSAAGWLRVVLETIGWPALCFAYVAGLTLLFDTTAGRRWARLVVPLGRMALTNYLGQSALCIAIFYGVGFGLFGRVSLTVAAAVAVGVLLFEALFSAWWLRRASFGPVEWLWRQFTYRSRMALWRADAAKRTA